MNNNNGTAQTGVIKEESLLKITLGCKINKTQENAIWCLSSSMLWERKCTFTLSTSRQIKTCFSLVVSVIYLLCINKCRTKKMTSIKRHNKRFTVYTTVKQSFLKTVTLEKDFYQSPKRTDFKITHIRVDKALICIIKKG